MVIETLLETATGVLILGGVVGGFVIGGVFLYQFVNKAHSDNALDNARKQTIASIEHNNYIRNQAIDASNFGNKIALNNTNATEELTKISNQTMAYLRLGRPEPSRANTSDGGTRKEGATPI